MKMLSGVSLLIALIFAYESPQSINALTGIIWNNNSSSFMKIFNIHRFALVRRDFFDEIRRMETENLKNIRLNVTAFEIPNLIDFNNDRRAITGVHGDTWNLLSEMLEFKFDPIKMNKSEFGIRKSDGSWSGLIGNIYRNETDVLPRVLVFPSRLTALEFSLPTWKTGFKFYLKQQWSYNPTWMLSLFHPIVWLSLVVLFLVLGLTSYWIENFRPNVSNIGNTMTGNDHWFYVFSVMCIQGWIPRPLQERSKLFLLSTTLCAWLTLIAFGSKLVPLMTHQDAYQPFTDLESLYAKTDYTLLVKKNSFVYSIFMNPPRPVYKLFTKSKRIRESDTNDAHRKCCSGKYVYLEAEDEMDARGFLDCELSVVGRTYYDTWISSGLTRGFRYKRAINIGMLKLHEFGLLQRMKRKWLRKTKAITGSTVSESIRMEQVYLIFAVLCFGFIFSIVVLLVERIIYLAKNNGKISPRKRNDNN